MEREISVTVEIAVALIAISALLGIVFFTVFMGNDMSNSVSMEASNLITIAEAGSIDELVGNNNIMPASGAYSLIRSRSSLIAEYRCSVGHKIGYCPDGKNGFGDDYEKDLVNLSAGTSPCILKHLTGKISLQVEFLNTGWYRLTVHYMNCNWASGVIDEDGISDTCNCNAIRAAG